MATNADAPFGLRYHSGGGEPAIITCNVASTDSAVLGYGDPVVFANTTSGVTTVTRAAANGGINGIVVDPKPTGFNYTDSDRRRTASVANTVQVMLVQPGDGKIFVIQSATGTSYSATMTDKFCNLATVGDANSVSAQSTVEVDLSSPHASAGDLRVLGLAPSPNGQTNEAGQAHAKLLVQIANT